MRNTFRILARDFKRLLRVPAGWVIAVALVVLPAFYAWVNIIGFWNPYVNTKDLQVSVANQDRGADIASIGKMNLGDQIVDSLKDNDDLGWRFVDKATAMDDVRSGRAYAAIIIPKDFSEQLGDLISGGDTRPKLTYYVNEKTGPIAPKITDTAAGTVERQVNETFVSTVSGVVAQVADSAAGTVDTQLDSAGQTLRTTATKAIDDAQQALGKARDGIAGFDAAGIDTTLQQARETLQTVDRLGGDAADALNGASTLVDTTRQGINETATTAGDTLDDVDDMLARTSSTATSAVTGVTQAIGTANNRVGDTLDTLRDLNDRDAALIDDLRALAVALPGSHDAIDQAISRLTQANDSLGNTISDLSAVNDSIGATTSDTTTLATNLDTSLQRALRASRQARGDLQGEPMRDLDAGLGSIAAAAGTLGGQLDAQHTLTAQASTVIDQIGTAVDQAADALGDTAGRLSDTQQKLETLGTDLNTLASADIASALDGVDLDGSSIASFMQSPTVLDTKVVYPITAYGAGMAPLLTNLAMWAGVFMLVAMLRLDPDDEGIDGMTDTQAYMGRWLLLALLAALQGLVVSLGDLVIGVAPASPALFVATAVLVSLSYSTIAYMLSTTLLHVGKGLVMVLLILQIQGGGGMYPVELMPGFFHAIAPAMPFTYAIGAMRETIGGLYGHDWVSDMLVLLLFAVASMAIGVCVRPRMAGAHSRFSRELEAAGMFNGTRTVASAGIGIGAASTPKPASTGKSANAGIGRHIRIGGKEARA